MNIVNVVVIDRKDGKLLSIDSFVDDEDSVEVTECFLDKCQEQISNFDEYDGVDMTTIIDNMEARTGVTIIRIVPSQIDLQNKHGDILI